LLLLLLLLPLLRCSLPPVSAWTHLEGCAQFICVDGS
jgi:hypothetical protein